MVIQETKNIFTTGRAKGDSFIGRQSIIDYFCSDWKQHSETGNNHALHGLNRMGKSSIAEETLRRIKAISPDAICIYERLGSSTWPALIKRICYKIIHAGYFDDESVKEMCEEIINIPLSEEVMEDQVTTLFELLMEYTCENSQKFVLIIDEFDAARVHWTDDYFVSLREIADKCSRFLIVISRRPLKIIEEDSRGNSNFHGVFKEMYLGSFDREDMEDYYLKLNQLYGISLDEEEKRDLEYFSGCCPFFLSRIGDRLACAAIEGQEIPSIEKICSEKGYRENCIQQYEDILERMQEDGLWEDVVKVLMGITVLTDPGESSATLTKDQATILENRGYLRHNIYDDPDALMIYSSDFTAWAKKKTTDCTLTETYKYIIESEVAIREMLREEMPKIWKLRGFINDWNDDFLDNKYYVPEEFRHVTKPKFDPRGNPVPSQLQRYLKTARIWNEDAEVVDALTIYDKLNLVKVYWNYGISERFGGVSYSEWEDCFTAILEIRNPLFHANITVSSSSKFYKLAEANEFCIRIINQLNS